MARTEIQAVITGDSTGAVTAFERTTAAAKATTAQVEQLDAASKRTQATWAAPSPSTRYGGAQGAIGNQLGNQLGIDTGAAGVEGAVGIIGGLVAAAGQISKAFGDLAGVINKQFARQGPDINQAASAQDVAAAISGAASGRTLLGDALTIGSDLFKPGGPLRAGFNYFNKQHAESPARKMIDQLAQANPAELLAAIPYLSADDQQYASDKYKQATAHTKFLSGLSPAAAPSQGATTIHAAIIGSAGDAQSILSRASRNNGTYNTTFTAPRAP